MRAGSGVLLASLMLAACDGCRGCDPPRNTSVPIAQCQDAQGDVREHPEGELVWNPVRIGQDFGAGHWLRTGERAKATVVFLSGGPPLDIGANSTVVLKPPPSSQPKELRVAIKRGTVRGKLRPNADRHGDVVVQLDSGESVRLEPTSEETEYRISVRDDDKTEVAVLRGQATLATKNGRQRLKSGEAQDLSRGAITGALVKLPDFPNLRTPAVDARFLLRTGRAIALTWAPSKKVDRYQIQVARDGVWPSLDAHATTPRRQWNFTPENTGVYFWRVASERDTRRSEFGFARRIYVDLRPAIELLETPKHGSTVVSAKRARIQLIWRSHREDTRYRVQIFSGASFQGAPIFDEKTQDTSAVVKLRPGRYTWGVLIEEPDGRMWPAFDKAHTFKVQRSKVRLRVPDKITFD